LDVLYGRVLNGCFLFHFKNITTMPIWRKPSDKYPDKWQLCRIVGEEETFPLMFSMNIICDLSGKTYRRQEVEWLDISETSFTKQDMMIAYDAGWDVGTGNYGAFHLFMKK